MNSSDFACVKCARARARDPPRRAPPRRAERPRAPRSLTSTPFSPPPRTRTRLRARARVSLSSATTATSRARTASAPSAQRTSTSRARASASGGERGRRVSGRRAPAQAQAGYWADLTAACSEDEGRSATASTSPTVRARASRASSVRAASARLERRERRPRARATRPLRLAPPRAVTPSPHPPPLPPPNNSRRAQLQDGPDQRRAVRGRPQLVVLRQLGRARRPRGGRRRGRARAGRGLLLQGAPRAALPRVRREPRVVRAAPHVLECHDEYRVLWRRRSRSARSASSRRSRVLLFYDVIKQSVLCVFHEIQQSKRRLTDAIGEKAVTRLGPVFANAGVHARIVITFFQIVSTYSSICIQIPWPNVLNHVLNIQVRDDVRSLRTTTFAPPRTRPLTARARDRATARSTPRSTSSTSTGSPRRSSCARRGSRHRTCSSSRRPAASRSSCPRSSPRATTSASTGSRARTQRKARTGASRRASTAQRSPPRAAARRLLLQPLAPAAREGGVHERVRRRARGARPRARRRGGRGADERPQRAALGRAPPAAEGGGAVVDGTIKLHEDAAPDAARLLRGPARVLRRRRRRRRRARRLPSPAPPARDRARARAVGAGTRSRRTRRRTSTPRTTAAARVHEPRAVLDAVPVPHLHVPDRVPARCARTTATPRRRPPRARALFLRADYSTRASSAAPSRASTRTSSGGRRCSYSSSSPACRSGTSCCSTSTRSASSPTRGSCCATS